MAEAPALPQPFINLQRGWPSKHLLPNKAVQIAADSVLSDPERAGNALLYGPSKGSSALREACSAWLSRLYGFSPSEQDPENKMPSPTSPERLSVTTGASGNLADIMAAFTDPVYTRRVWMVEPTYFLACTTFEDAGFQGRLVGFPEGDTGLDVELLRERILAVDRAEPDSARGFKSPAGYPRLYRHVIYLVPTFSNPSGKTYSLERRQALVRLARETNALIITDDCYDFLSWAAPSEGAAANGSASNGKLPSTPTLPPRIVDVDCALSGGDLEWGNSVSNGSFSKVMGPGLRCGWVEATPAFISRLSKVGPSLSGGCPGHFSSTLIEHVLRTGALEAHIRDVLVPTYRKRSDVLRKAISEYLGPFGVQIDTGYSSQRGDSQTEELAGGFFLYILFPNGVSADEVAKIAMKDYNLQFLSAGSMAVKGSETSSDLLKRGARLCWAWEEEEQLIEGVRRIAETLREKFDITRN